MRKPSKEAVRLVGFLMAHATWIITDLEPGELYVPQVLCEIGGELQLSVFEAETQVEAVSNGKKFLAERADEFDRCAFARDGQMKSEHRYIDVLTISVTDGSASPVLVVVQPYRKVGGMRLLGDEAFFTPDGLLLTSDVSRLRAALREGSLEHSSAAENWTDLNSTRLESPKLFD